MMTLPKGRTAFTLIELLIVVAIIAILAAVAVPNFLEAQMRAQISRVKADMRSIATALESYKIDTNLYPPTGLFLDGEQIDYPDGYLVGWGGITLITTPIAYMSSYPADVFMDFQGWTHRQPKNVKNRPIYYDCWAQDPIGGANESNSMFFSASRGRGMPERAMGLVWALFSPGPTIRKQTPASEGDDYGWYFYTPRDGFPSMLNPYDPTNGTRSVGSIARYSAGEMDMYTGSAELP